MEIATGMVGHAAVVVNPQAGAIRRRRVDPGELVGMGATVYTPRTAAELSRCLREIGAAATEVIAVVGGDGTLHRVISELIDQRGDAGLPDFVLLPAGTINGISRSLGVRGQPARLLQALRRGAAQVRSLPVLRIDLTLPGGHTRRVHGFTFGIGLILRAFAAYARKDGPGLLDAVAASLEPVRSLLRGGAFFAPPPLEVRRGGAPWLDGAVHSALASVLDNPALWFTPFGAPLEGRPAFHALACALPPGELIAHLWPLFRGTCRRPGHRIGELAELEVSAAEGYMIDGDVHLVAGAFQARISLGPCLRVRVPAVASDGPRPGPRSGRAQQRRTGPRPGPALDVADHVARLRALYGDNLALVLLFGSCLSPALRSPTSIPDFFVVVDDPPETHWIDRQWRRALPPDLFRLREAGLDCKYYLLSRHELWRETGPDARDLYVLGRLSKRAVAVYARDAAAVALAQAVLARAPLLAARHAAGLLEGPVDEDGFYREVLRLSYRGERRLEDAGKIEALFAAHAGHYRDVLGGATQALLAEGVLVRDGAGRLLPGPAADEAGARRFVHRSLLRAFLRWPRMAWTTEGWMDLLLAKLERTHGVHLEIPAWERPVILLTGWRHYLRLQREGRIH